VNFIKEDFQDILSYKEALAIICLLVNYAYQQTIIDVERLAKFIGIPHDNIKKMGRIFEILRLGKIYTDNGRTMLEIFDIKDEEIKNTMYEAIWNKKEDYASIYKQLIVDGMENN